MAARSIATLSLSFGLVSIPVKLYSATESSSAIRFKLMGSGGTRVRQQYVADAPPSEPIGSVRAPVQEPDPGPSPKPSKSRGAASSVVDFPTRKTVEVAVAPGPESDPEPEPEPSVVERADMVKGFEFEKGKFVLFTAAELKALEAGSRQTIDIVAFVPERSIDPLYVDKAYFLAPDKRGAKPYSLLLRAMHDTGRCALAKWAFRSKEYAVQIRPATGGMVLQQLLYAEEVRSLADLDIDLVEVGAGELALAKQLIEQRSVDAYDPTQFVDEEKKRILAAVEEKIEGRQIVDPGRTAQPAGAEVVDLMEALRASLRSHPAVGSAPTTETPAQRKPVKRAAARETRDSTPKTRVKR